MSQYVAYDSSAAPPVATFPVIVEPGASPSGSTGEANKLTPARPHSIELDVVGTSVFIWRDADPAMVTAIIGALQAAK
jgi:hypothetical protein